MEQPAIAYLQSMSDRDWSYRSTLTAAAGPAMADGHKGLRPLLSHDAEIVLGVLIVVLGLDGCRASKPTTEAISTLGVACFSTWAPPLQAPSNSLNPL